MGGVWKYIQVIGGCGMWSLLQAGSVSMEAYVQPSSIVPPGTRIQIIYEAKALAPLHIRFAPRLSPGGLLRSVRVPSCSRGVDVRNFQVSYTLRCVWELETLDTGTVLVHAGEIQDSRGKRYPLPDVEIRIVPSTQIPDHQTKGSVSTPQGDVFLLLEVNRTEVYPGEPVHVRYRLLSRHPILNVKDRYFPDISGYWVVGEFPLDSIYVRSTFYEGEHFYEVRIGDHLVIPARPGILWVDSMSVEAIVEMVRYVNPFEDWVPDWVRRQWKILDDAFRIPDISPVRLRLYAPGKRIRVHPFPEPVPASFTGLTGTFRVWLDSLPDTVQSGQVVTYRLFVRGKGYLPAIRLHALTQSFGKPSLQNVRVRRAGTQVYSSGELVWQVLVDSGVHVLEFPGWWWIVFQSERQKYDSTWVPERKIIVLPGTSYVSGGGRQLLSSHEDTGGVASAESSVLRTLISSPVWIGAGTLLLLGIIIGSWIWVVRHTRQRTGSSQWSREERKLWKEIVRYAREQREQAFWEAVYRWAWEILRREWRFSDSSRLSGYFGKATEPVRRLNFSELQKQFQRAGREDLLQILEVLREAEWYRFQPPELSSSLNSSGSLSRWMEHLQHLRKQWKTWQK